MTASAAAKAPPRKRRTLDVLAALRRPRVALMLVMGIASGLPFMLIGNTLGFWLADDGISLAAIGALSWVGLTYIVKFIWGVMVDRLKVPLLVRLGRRRSWMLLAQLVAGGGLIGMGLVDPKHQLGWLVAFASDRRRSVRRPRTRQLDAWRIEDRRRRPTNQPARFTRPTAWATAWR